MLSCQVELQSDDYGFLSHDSYANCAQPIKAKFDLFVVDNMKYCGILNEADLIQVQQRIIASGNLTVDEMSTFFGTKYFFLLLVTGGAYTSISELSNDLKLNFEL